MRKVSIHALGPSGSGKTVFMAALYNRLLIRRPNLTFYLKTDPQASLQLNTLYNRIASPTEAWPEASQAVNEWHFRACIPTPTGDFEPLEFVYLDYPGGALTNPRAMDDPAIRSLVDRLRSANALLVLLDGQAMLSLLRGERTGRRYMEFDVISSLEIAQQSRCPVHFAITKWDLLEGQYSLGDVRFKLMEDENFANLINSKGQDMPGTIRLIPVSAVGFGFAQLLPTGEMKKIGDRPRPHQVELPLVAVLPDFFQFAYAELSARQEDVKELKQARDLQRAFDQIGEGRMKAIMRTVLEKAMPSLHAMLAQRSPALASVLALGGDWSIDEVVDHAHRFVEEGVERLDRERAKRATAELLQGRQQVASDKEALDLLKRQADQLITDFEIDHPESVLAGGVEEFSRDESWEAALQAGAPVSRPEDAANRPDLAQALLGSPFGAPLPPGYAIAGFVDGAGSYAAKLGGDMRASLSARIVNTAGGSDEAAGLDILVFDDHADAEAWLGTAQETLGSDHVINDTFVPAGFRESAACLSFSNVGETDGQPVGTTVCLARVDRTVVVAHSDWHSDLSHGNEGVAQGVARAGAAHVASVVSGASLPRVPG